MIFHSILLHLLAAVQKSRLYFPAFGPSMSLPWSPAGLCSSGTVVCSLSSTHFQLYRLKLFSCAVSPTWVPSSPCFDLVQPYPHAMVFWSVIISSLFLASSTGLESLVGWGLCLLYLWILCITCGTTYIVGGPWMLFEVSSALLSVSAFGRTSFPSVASCRYGNDGALGRPESLALTGLLLAQRPWGSKYPTLMDSLEVPFLFDVPWEKSFCHFSICLCLVKLMMVYLECPCLQRGPMTSCLHNSNSH